VASNINPPAFAEDTQSLITLSYTDVEVMRDGVRGGGAAGVTVTTACGCVAGVCTVGVTGHR